MLISKRGPKIGSTKKKRGPKSFVAQMKKAVAKNNIKDFMFHSAAWSNPTPATLNKAKQYLRLQKLRKAPTKENGTSTSEDESAHQQQSSIASTTNVNACYFYGENFVKIMQIHFQKYIFTRSRMPIFYPNYNKSDNFDHGINFSGKTVWMNEDKSKGSFICHVNDIYEIFKKICEMQFAINRRSERNNVELKYNTQSRQLLK